MSLSFALRITAFYLTASIVWILGSDWLVATLLPQDAELVQTMKGLFFVLCTGAVIYLLARSYERREIEARQQLRTARDRALDASRAKSVFLAHMSHEIRTPLNAISGFSDVMKSEVFGPVGQDRYRGYVEAIHSSSRHLTELLGDIIDLSQIEAGEISLNTSQVRLHPEITECLSLVRADAGEKGLSIETDLDETFCLLTSPLRLRQVVTNLLTNAVRYTESGGIRVLAGVQADGSARIEIADTGAGIDANKLASIREFIAAGSPSARRRPFEVGGSGLGLAITYRIAQLLGVRLDIDSESGQGTRAAVTFPPELVLRLERKAG